MGGSDCSLPDLLRNEKEVVGHLARDGVVDDGPGRGVAEHVVDAREDARVDAFLHHHEAEGGLIASWKSGEKCCVF